MKTIQKLKEQRDRIDKAIEKLQQMETAKKSKWVKFPNLGIEVNFEQQQNGVLFKDIKLNEGENLLEIQHLGEVGKYIVDNKLDVWTYIKQPIKVFEGEYVARFYANSAWVDLNYNGYPSLSSPALGVLTWRKLK